MGKIESMLNTSKNVMNPTPKDAKGLLRSTDVIELATVIEALQAYRNRLRERGKPSKADAVEYCIAIVKQLAK